MVVYRCSKEYENRKVEGKRKMEELRNRYFERLNNFSKNSYSISKELLSYRYGELYGLLDSMRIVNIISFEKYLCLMN